jgi:DivIVA domain-containing protein
MEQVDAFLEAVRDTFLGVRHPPLTADEVRAKQFAVTRLRPGYDEQEVDAFLEDVEARLRVRCAECGAETTETTEFCAVCEAPAVGQRPVAADPLAGGPGDDLETVPAALRDARRPPAWLRRGRPAPTVLTGGFGPDDEVSDVAPARRGGRIVQVTIAAVSVLAVAVAMVAVAGSAAHRHASTSVRLMAALTAPGRFVSSVAFSPDGHTLAAGDGNGRTYLWDVAAGHRIAALTDPESGGLSSVAFSPDGHTLAAGDADGWTYLWDVGAGHRIATLTDPGGVGINAVAFSPDGHTLAVGDGNGSTYLWDVATGHRIATLTDPEFSGVSSVAFSPDGHTLATGDADDGTYLWDVATGHRIATLTYPGSIVFSVAFSPDGHTLATADGHGITYLWDVAARRRIAAFTAPGGVGINAVAFSPDGHTVATSGDNGSTYLWYVR